MKEQTDTPKSLIDDNPVLFAVEDCIQKLERERNALMEQINCIAKDKVRMDWLDHNQFRIENIQEIEYRIKKGFVTTRDAIDDAMRSELKEVLKGDK